MYTTRPTRRLGNLGFDADAFAQIASAATQGVTSVISATKSAPRVATPAPAAVAPAATGTGINFLDSLSNTDLAIGGVASLALVMTLLR